MIFEAKGVKINNELAVNLPPGIIRKVAEQIETCNNIRIKEDVIKNLETKINVLNKIDEKRQKEIELAKAQEDTERAKTLVEEGMIENSKVMGELFMKELKKINSPLIKEVRGL